MTIHSNKALAINLLKGRRANYSFGHYMRLFRLQIILGIVVIGICIGLLAADRFNIYSLVMIGMMVGSFLRDLVWIRMVRSTKAFQELITDWEKVEQLAAADDSDDPQASTAAVVAKSSDALDSLTPEERFNKENDERL